MAIRRITDASAHISDTNNPHLTTASQVGAYSIPETNGLLDGKADKSHVHAISDITNLQTSLDAKQAVLVSGTNIKTINGNSVLGSGDIVISGSGNLDGLSDVTITTPSSGQVLQYNGTVWVNATPSSGGASYTYTTTAVSKTLVDRERVNVTAASLTITLPATPVDGMEVWISVDNFSNTVVARNGSTILGVADDYIINKAYATVGFYYHNNTWRVF